jgi:hypothetical protein
MPDKATLLETLFDKAEDYGKTHIELYKLKAIDASANIVSHLAMLWVMAMVVAMFILTISIGMAFWIGELLGKYYYGFWVIAGVYSLIALMLYIFRYTWIKVPVSNSFITQIRK